MNDNIVKLLIEEDKESLIWRIELTTKKIVYFLKGGASVWKTMAPELADFSTQLPSEDKLFTSFSGDQIIFTKAGHHAFIYEDIKFLILKAKSYRLLRHDFLNRILAASRNTYEICYTIFNPDRTSFFSEITIKSGLHLLFSLSDGYTVKQLYLDSIIKDLQLGIKEKSRPAVISFSEHEIHVIGDEINYKSIALLVSVLIKHDVLFKEAADIFANLILVAHIKDIAHRELMILQNTLSLTDKELYAPYIEIFSILARHGEFHYLNAVQLGLLVTLYDNRKDIYSFPLMIRIPLRSIYICFHEEIREMLK